MPFDNSTCTILQRFTTIQPPTEDLWYGPWTSILTTLFPTTQGYMVAPQRRFSFDDPENHDSDFIIEVMKLSTAPFTLRCVLVVKIRNSQHWEPGLPVLQCLLDMHTHAALRDTGYLKVYWIGAIGPHWRYGEKEYDGQELRPLIDWHHTTHDQASFDDLQTLAQLVAAL
ncbi:hypothetical protein D9615_006203 [Tricholomella constricta]|uniref:Uncharacterized protein n=1 Tax=Tricholomella constricta TaxID=117010 RepID=A0A8H5HBP4_9AGAR|nr:hypothetical protein D9615_006203 [Tricholomella constricta]